MNQPRYVMERKTMKLITRLVSIFIAVWLIAMIAYPVFSSNFNWVETQRVWDRWQTLNSGMIALLAAMLAIYATQYIENKKRERSLIAEKSLLPLALSELSEYCIGLAEYLKMEHQEWKKDTLKKLSKNNNLVPNRPTEWIFDAFKNCMIHEQESEAKFMASILSDTQIISSRFRTLKDDNLLVTQRTFISRRNEICLLHAKIDRMFKYSREHSLLLTTEITEEEKCNSAAVLDFECIA